MSAASQRFLLGLGFLLATGAEIGWYYGHADWGLLVAVRLALTRILREAHFETAFPPVRRPA